MTSVGLTGGIGSGKSEVARRLAAAGAVVIDSDVLAREAVEPGSPGLAAVVTEFGDEVLGADGGLDRARLGRIVFADPARRRALEAVVHPHVRRRSAELAAVAPAGSVVVHDVPLLVEQQMQDRYDVVVVVDLDPQTQLSRLVQGRDLTEAEARARIRSQATREQRRAVADIVLTNDGDLAALQTQVDTLWSQLLKVVPRTE